MVYSAKISTIGEKAEDIFKISTADNKRLNDVQKSVLSDALKDALS